MSDVDTNELGLRVQGAFSAGEMRGLLQRWGLSGESAPTDAARLARELVRAGHKRFGLAELVRRLRTERPLVEWPEVSGEDARFAPRATEIPGTDVGPNDEPAAGAERAPGVSPTIVDDELVVNQAARTQGEAVVPSSRLQPGPAPESKPMEVRRPLVFEPSEPAREPSRGIEPKHFLAALGLVVVLAGIAFAAGVAYTGRYSDASRAVGEQPRPAPSGPAAKAAALLSGGLDGVARLCAIDPEEALGHSVFVLAREDCGDPRSRVRRPRTNPRIPDLPPEPDRPTTDEPEAAPEPPRPATAPLPAVKNDCVSACQRVRRDCNGACGAEPSEASLYDAYNACKGRCLSAESRCRLSCN